MDEMKTLEQKEQELLAFQREILDREALLNEREKELKCIEAELRAKKEMLDSTAQNYDVFFDAVNQNQNSARKSQAQDRAVHKSEGFIQGVSTASMFFAAIVALVVVFVVSTLH